jgi:hypothetical protein
MAIVQRDYILRLIEQAAAALRRVLRLTADGEPAAAVREAQDAARALLGPMVDALTAVDPATAAQLMGDPPRLGAWAQLLAAEAAARRALDQETTADLAERRALAIALEAAARQPPDGGPEARSAVAMLRGRVDAALLPDRYRGLLAALDRSTGEQR